MDLGNIFFGFLFLAVPVSVLVTVLYAFCASFFQSPSPEWQQAEGVIEESSLQRDSDGEFFAAIRYKFFVNGQPYWGEGLSYSGKFDGQEKLESIVSTYCIGSRIKIEFSPENPEHDSELNTDELLPKGKVRTLLQLIGFMVFLVVFLCVGIVLLYTGFNPSPDN